MRKLSLVTLIMTKSMLKDDLENYYKNPDENQNLINITLEDLITLDDMIQNYFD